MGTAVQRFSGNPRGRDFVVGDIHGEFTRLESALHGLGFDPGRDRLFSVGDLIDRGPDSPAALAWLARPWFHAVLGNHEAMLIDPALTGQQRLWWLLANGGTWWLAQGAREQARFLAAFRALPVACEVATPAGRIGIVHADVPDGLDWATFTRALEAGDEAVRHRALWSRERAYSPTSAPVAGIHQVFCGHTPVPAPTVVGNVHLIDTGACFGGPLTIIRLGDPADRQVPASGPGPEGGAEETS